MTMKIARLGHQFEITVSRDELILLAHCILEARGPVGDNNFVGRVGVEWSEAESLLRQMIEAKRNL
jgi:hypothetical protein